MAHNIEIESKALTSQADITATKVGKESSPACPEARLLRWLPRAVLCALAVILCAFFWLPMHRISADVEINYNEGWNSYKQAMVKNGTPLYGLPPGTLTGATTYPPVWFHLVSSLGNRGTLKNAGRWISLISWIGTGIFIFLIVTKLGASIEVALFSLLLYLVGIPLLAPGYVGMNDPQLFGEALTTAGLYFYIKNPENMRMLALSALAFCFAGFAKQTLLAFPMAVALDLILRSRKLFAVWAGSMLAFAAAFTVLSILVDGKYFLAHLTLHRAYSLRYAWHHNVHLYLVMVEAVLLVAIGWLICASRPRRTFAILFVVSQVMGFFLAGGDGVGLNICFNAFAAAVIICGVALADAGAVTSELGAAIPRVQLLPATLMSLILLGVMINVPGRLRESMDALRALPSQKTEFASALQFLRSQPGPALCESPLLCYEAGKSFEFDSFSVNDGLKTGRVTEDHLVELLRSHYFLTLQIKVDPGEASQSEEELAQGRSRPSLPLPFEVNVFTGGLMKELVENYRVAYRNSWTVIFVPR